MPGPRVPSNGPVKRIPAGSDEQLSRYVQLLDRYHHTLDLMSEQGRRDLDRHLHEAKLYAELAERLAGSEPTVVDVGSGAGLPGVVIATMLPRARVLLVERRRRRSAFLELVRGALELDNVEVFSGDVIDLDGVSANVITAQAVAAMSEIVRLTRHLHTDPCYLVSRRSEGWRDDLDEVWRAAGLAAPEPDEETTSASKATADAAAARLPAGAELIEEPLDHRGSLVALRLPGGSACL